MVYCKKNLFFSFPHIRDNHRLVHKGIVVPCGKIVCVCVDLGDKGLLPSPPPKKNYERGRTLYFLFLLLYHSYSSFLFSYSSILFAFWGDTDRSGEQDYFWSGQFFFSFRSRLFCRKNVLENGGWGTTLRRVNQRSSSKIRFYPL